MELNSFRIDVVLASKNIDYLNRVFEGYDHLCLVSTVDPGEARIKIWGYGKIGPVKRILRGLPFPCEILE